MNFSPARSSFVAAPAVETRNWTEDQIIQLVGLVRHQGLSDAQAAVIMGRSEISIVGAVSKYRCRDRRAQIRVCIPCRRPFYSLDIGNRICGRCKEREIL